VRVDVCNESLRLYTVAGRAGVVRWGVCARLLHCARAVTRAHCRPSTAPRADPTAPHAHHAVTSTCDVVQLRVSTRQRLSAPGNALATACQQGNGTVRLPRPRCQGNLHSCATWGCRRGTQAADKVSQVSGHPCGVCVHLVGWFYPPCSTQEHLEIRSYRWYDPPWPAI